MMRLRTAGLWLGLVALLALAPAILARYRHAAVTRAIRRGNLPQIRTLLAGSADVNIQSENRTTALMIAAGAGDLGYVRHLLSRGARVNVSNGLKRTALSWAAEAGHLAIVEELLAAGAIPGGGYFTEWESPRALAKRAGHRRVASLLSNRETLSRELHNQTLAAWKSGVNREAFAPGRLDRWRRLLQRGASPHWQDVNGDALMALAAIGDDAGILLTLEFPVDLTIQNRWDADLTCVAAAYCQTTTLERLIQRGAAVDGLMPFETPLAHAVANGRADNARLLLEHGADPNRKWLEQSPLTWAVQTKHPELIPLLKEYGAFE